MSGTFGGLALYWRARRKKRGVENWETKRVTGSKPRGNYPCKSPNAALGAGRGRLRQGLGASGQAPPDRKAPNGGFRQLRSSRGRDAATPAREGLPPRPPQAPRNLRGPHKQPRLAPPAPCRTPPPTSPADPPGSPDAPTTLAKPFPRSECPRISAEPPRSSGRPQASRRPPSRPRGHRGPPTQPLRRSPLPPPTRRRPGLTSLSLPGTGAPGQGRPGGGGGGALGAGASGGAGPGRGGSASDWAAGGSGGSSSLGGRRGR